MDRHALNGLSAIAFSSLMVILAACTSSPSETSTVASSEKEPSVAPFGVVEAEPLPSTPPPTKVSQAERAAAARLRQVGLDYRSAGEWEGAITALQESVTLDPETLSGRVILGWTLHLAGRALDAEAALQAALQRDADHIPALNALGIVYLVDGQLEKAIAAHERAARLDTDNEIAFYNLSLAYQRKQDYETAIQHAIRATELEPDNSHPWVALAIAHWSYENLDEARSAYEQALQLDGGYWDSFYLGHLAQSGFSAAQIELSDLVRQSVTSS